MRHDIKLLIEKQQSGTALCTDEIRSMMFYALDLLKEFEQHTLASIERANCILADQYKIALASNVLTGRVKPTPAQTRSLAASVMGQDEKKGNSTAKKSGK